MRYGFLFWFMFLITPAYSAWQGDQIQTLEGLQQPSAVSISDSGEVFVLDGVAGKVVVFNDQGQRIREIKAPVSQPMNLAMDLVLTENKLVVADTANHRLLLFSLAGQLLESISLPDAETDCPKEQIEKEQRQSKVGKIIKNEEGLLRKYCKQPSEPVGLSYQSNTIYWSDRKNHRVCKTALLNNKTTCWGEYGRSDNQFRYPFMLASDKDNYLYVVDVLNARIQVFNYRGKLFGNISDFGLTAGALFRPNGITVDKENSLFVSDTYLGTISSFKERHFTGNLRDAQGQVIHLEQPVGMHVKNNKLYVVELGKKRVVVYQLEEVQGKVHRKTVPHVSRQDCVTCHVEWADSSKTIVTPEKSISPKVAEQKMCLSCHHGAVIDSRRAMMQGEQHPDYYHKFKDKDFETLDERKDSIDKTIPILKSTTPYCGSCHTPHAQHKDEIGIHPNHKNSWMRKDNSQGKLCDSCHKSYYQSESKDKKTANHPVSIHLQKPPDNKESQKLGEKEKAYAKDLKLQKGLPKILKKQGAKVAEGDATTCESCHLLHGAKDKGLLVLEQGELCGECHQDKDSKDKEAAHKKGLHPVNIEPKDKMTLNKKKVEKVECKTCHDVHGGLASSLLHEAKTENTQCEDCHARQASLDKKEAHHKGIHPIHEKLDSMVEIGKKEIKSVECQSCHSIHQGKPMTAALLEKEKPLCATCHKKQHSKTVKEARKKGIHPVNFKPDRKIMLDKKNIKEVQCKTCHSVHKGLKNTASLIKNEKQLCSSCHEKQEAKNKKEARKKGIHPVHIKLDKPIKFNNKTITQVECSTCHSVHKGKPKTPALVKKNINKMCVSCHARQHANSLREARKKGVHPVNIKLEKPIIINKKKIQNLDCMSCHSVHQGKPNTPALVQDHKKGELCKNCHKSEAAVAFSDHNLQRTAPHSKNMNRKTPVQAGVCGSCHSMHKAPKGADRLFVGAGVGAMANKINKRDRSCFACHRDKGIANDKAIKKYTHPMRDLVMKSNPKDFPLVDKYGNTQKQGQIACITCHNPHRWMPKGGQHSRIVKGKNEEGNVLNSFLNHKSPQGSFCVDCHGIESQIRYKYYHDKRGRPGNAGYIK